MSNPPRISAARRNAEALLSSAQKRESDFKLEQEHAREAMALKTARLRELPLAKERLLIDPQSPTSRLPGRARKCGAPSRNNRSGNQQRKWPTNLTTISSVPTAIGPRRKRGRKSLNVSKRKRRSARRRVAMSPTPKRIRRTYSHSVHHGEKIASPP